MTMKQKHQRQAALFAAIEALQVEIQDREHALEALEVVYFGENLEAKAEKLAKVKKTEEKAPRGSATRPRKKARQSRPWTKERRAKHEAKKAAATAEKAPAAVSAHQALKDESERQVNAATNGPNPSGSLTGLKLAPAIRAILSKAARPLTSTEIMDRLNVGGYQHTAAGPLVNSVTGVLSGMGLIYERRAGRNYYDPLPKEGDE